MQAVSRLLVSSRNKKPNYIHIQAYLGLFSFRRTCLIPPSGLIALEETAGGPVSSPLSRFSLERYQNLKTIGQISTAVAREAPYLAGRAFIVVFVVCREKRAASEGDGGQEIACIGPAPHKLMHDHT